MTASSAHLTTGWPAKLHLGFRRAPGRTILAERRREGPLAVQQSLYPEGDLCHVYVLHPPGGVAGGDRLRIDVTVDRAAAALLTTPGATKFYHSIGPRATLHQHIDIRDGALEWLPQENILFPGADADLETRINLSAGARFIGWEITCFGRPAINEAFDRGRVVTRFNVFRDEQPVLLETLHIDGRQSHGGAASLRGSPVAGTLCATIEDSFDVDSIRDAITCPAGHAFGISVVDGLLVARYLGDSTEQARTVLQAVWSGLRPHVLGRLPCPPRIWYT